MPAQFAHLTTLARHSYDENSIEFSVLASFHAFIRAQNGNESSLSGLGHNNMIKVEGLTKRYARTVAVDNISFEVDKGQIVGFLGPNGAGKTTTMRVLTCFLPPTSGRANVAGYDVLENAMEVKKRIGYL